MGHRDLLSVQKRGEGADLRNADLSGANLKGADLSGANLAGADLTGVVLMGVRSFNLYVDDSTKLPAGYRVTDPRSGYLIGPNVDLRRANLAGADLKGADLTAADLKGAHATAATSLAWHPSRASVLLAAFDGTVSLWEPPAGPS